MEKKKNNEKQRVLLVPFPLQGHMTPMLQLGNILHAQGFSITIAHTNFNAPNPSTHPDFDFHSLADNLPKTESPTGRNILTFLESINIYCESSLQELVSQMRGQEQEEAYGKLVGIVYDSLGYFAEVVAALFKIPSIIFRSNSPSYLLAYRALPRLIAQGYFPLRDSIMQELVPELHPLRFKDLPFSGESLESAQSLLAVTSNVRTSSAIIWNTMDYLEHKSLSKLQEHYKVPFFIVGPLHKIAQVSSTSLIDEDDTCLGWLDKQAPNSIIYVSLGSLVSIDEKELAEMAWGLANSGHPFLWVVRPGSVVGSTWIELFPEGFLESVGEKGYIVKWAPQKKVLAHCAVGGFWSHCGWNSTLESISEGVPMIIRPHLVDQKVNARYLSYVWRVGVELEDNLERVDIGRVIKRVLGDKEMRQRAIELKEEVNACICEGGSSYNSVKGLVKFLSSHN